jgi:hypothetical protein
MRVAATEAEAHSAVFVCHGDNTKGLEMAKNRQVNTEDIDRMVAEAAYFRALARGFEEGDPLSDWLDAEKEIQAKFNVAAHDKKLQQLHEQLAEANEQLRKIALTLKSEAKEEWREEVERLHQLRDTLSDKLDEVRVHTDQAKRKAKREADQLWKKLVAGIERMGHYTD